MRTRGHRACEQSTSDDVELAGVAEPERAQERPDRRQCNDPMPRHRTCRPGSQCVDVLDAVPASQERVDQGEALAIRIRTRAARNCDVLTQQRPEPESLSERGRDQQPGIGHAVGVIGYHLDAVTRA